MPSLRLIIVEGGIMEIWKILLGSLLLPIILSAVFSFFWFFKVRGEKKISSQEQVIRTRPPKSLSGFFLGFALIVLFGGIAGIIYCCITDSENTSVSTVIIISVCVAVFSAIGFLGYAVVRFNYVVADNEGIFSCRLFRKKRFYRYEEIGFFQDTINLGMVGGVIGYDKNNSKIFAIEAVHIGASAVAQRLREHKVQEKFKSIHLNKKY